MKLLLILPFLFLATNLFAEIEARLVGIDGRPAKVVDQHLVVGKFDFNISSFALLTNVDLAQNFFLSKAGSRFIIDCLIYSGDRNIAANEDATMVIYESTSAVSAVRNREIYQDKLSRGERFGLCGLNKEIREGFYVNAETDDNDISLNILGYFLPN